MNNAFPFPGLKLNGTLQLLVYADGAKTSILIKKNAEALLVKRDEIGLEVNAENTKCAPVF